MLRMDRRGEMGVGQGVGSTPFFLTTPNILASPPLLFFKSLVLSIQFHWTIRCAKREVDLKSFHSCNYCRSHQKYPPTPKGLVALGCLSRVTATHLPSLGGKHAH